MSSLIGHAATGIAIAMTAAGKDRRRMPPDLPGLTALAVCADFDYLFYWCFGIDLRPRFTHSLAFGLAAAATVWAVARIEAQDRQSHAGFPLLLLAACSHPVLDLLVGVHSLPLFWPFTSAEVASPIGVLPSAAHVSLTNYYLWRNLLIEMGVLLPVLAYCVASARAGSLSVAARKGALWLFPWALFVFWSVSVHRQVA